MYSEPQPSAARLDRELTRLISALREARQKHIEMPEDADPIYRTKVQTEHVDTERRVYDLLARKKALGYFTRESLT